ncbi:ABC-three component system protein [Roseivirga sp. BDSF3-8]|uniref:ABC-three component system protein n=1 Tax=Roseivirga sp. BDSF3-8 TaxID=3241598 RepID=UPI0035326D53
MTIDQAREYTVIVNGGSGCFFQPADPKATYILTAKHNIVNAGDRITDLTHFQYQNDHWEIFTIPFDNLETGVNYFPHPDKDIAIITVPRIEGLNALYKLIDLDTNPEEFWLLGYPETRRNGSPDYKIQWFRSDKGIGILGTTENARREAHIPGNPDLGEVRGHSGGCILKDAGNKLYLAGIQNSMAQAVDEQLGRIEFTPVEIFNEIIEEHPDKLSLLFPSYLSSFDFLRGEAFDLKAGLSQDNISYTKGYLQHKCKEVIDNEFTPIGIKNFFQTRLLIDQNKGEELETKNIWILWLEFLTILNIVKKQVHTVDNLSDIFDQYRLLFSDTNGDWCHEIPKLVYSDYKGLKKGGLVIVGVEKPPEDETYIIDGSIPLIAQVRSTQDRDQLKIDDGFGFPFDEFKFIHIDFFKKESIIKRHQEYAAINKDQDLLDKLRVVYGEVFTD